MSNGGSQIASSDAFDKACVKISLHPDDIADDYQEWTRGVVYESEQD